MWVGAILLTSILFSFNASTGCLYLLALVQKSEKSGRVAKKWPKREVESLYASFLNTSAVRQLSPSLPEKPFLVSKSQMSKCQNMRCRMVSHPSYIHTYSHSHTHTHTHTLIYTYINTAPGLYLCIWPEVSFCTGQTDFRWWSAYAIYKSANLYNTRLVNFNLTPM